VCVQEGKAFDGSSNPIPLGGDDVREAVSKAGDAEALWAAVGKDCWCVVPIKSTLNPEMVLEGTRLTVVSFTAPLHPLRMAPQKIHCGNLSTPNIAAWYLGGALRLPGAPST